MVVPSSLEVAPLGFPDGDPPGPTSPCDGGPQAHPDPPGGHSHGLQVVLAYVVPHPPGPPEFSFMQPNASAFD